MSGLSVVIPSKTASNLVACVTGILANEKIFPRIIVVDDGIVCDDNRIANFIHDCATIIPGEKPFVFARNCNIGIRAAGDDDVILLNDDAVLKTPQGFSKLKNVADTHPEYGIISAAANNVGNMNMIPRYSPTSLLREDKRMVCFVCVLIPRRTINLLAAIEEHEKGMLDERFVHYGMDDDDYSLRVRNAGLKIGIFDGCFVDHGSLKSTYRGDAAAAGGDFRPNLEIFKQKWGMDNFGRKL